MDNLLSQLLSFPPHPPPAIPLSDADFDNGLRGIVKLLNEVPAKKLTSGLSGGGGGGLLDVFAPSIVQAQSLNADQVSQILDPSINTLPYLYVLVAHINTLQGGKQVTGSQSSPLLPGGRLWDPMLRFMERFDPIQIRYGGSEFRRVISAVESAARKATMPAVAVHPIQLAILRLDPSGACFTSTHLIFLQLCLETRQFHMAKPVLDKDIYSFPLYLKPGVGNPLSQPVCSRNQPSSNFITTLSGFSERVTSKEILSYFLLGGMIYTGLRDWSRAIHFYEIAIVAPAPNAVSKIQVEAYNKRLLVGLLWKGTRLDLPRTTSATAAKVYQATSKPYNAVAEIFQESIRDETSPRRLRLELEAGQQIWLDDLNFGLIQQVVAAFRQFSVLRLGKTYSSITVADIAKRTSPDPNNTSETAEYLQWLISTGQLTASITQRGSSPTSWILKFAEDGPSMPEAQQLRELNETKARIQTLSARITESDHKIGLSKEYLEWCRKAEAKGKDEVPGIFQDMADEFIPDEDMMTDV